MRRILPLVAGIGGFLACVQPNHGSRIEMTLVGLPVLQRGISADDNPGRRHYELWASVQTTDPTTGTPQPMAVRVLDDGFTVQSVLGRMRLDPLPDPLADPAEYLTVDPCMIRRETGERIYLKPSELQALAAERGWTETDPEFLANARVQKRVLDLANAGINAITSYATRLDAPTITATSDSDRLAQCMAFFHGEDCGSDDACKHDRSKYYVGNPEEMTYPVNGAFYGIPGEGAETQDPASHGLLGGAEINSGINLKDLLQLFVTLEPDQFDATGDLIVDPANRGPVLTSGTARPVVRGMLRVELRNEGKTKTIYGTASVYYSLDEDRVQF